MLAEQVQGPFAGKAGTEFDLLHGAPTLIVIYANKHAVEPVGDCYICGAHLMLAAIGLGLSTRSLGFLRDVLRQESWRERLAIGDDFVPILPLAVGYAEETMPQTAACQPFILNWSHDTLSSVR
jgi:nitroreductase